MLCELLVNHSAQDQQGYLLPHFEEISKHFVFVHFIEVSSKSVYSLGRWKLLPLLKHFDALKKVIPYSDVLDGSFESLLAEHVRDPWLSAWLDALAFSLSGQPAAQTGAAALAYTLFDLHREVPLPNALCSVAVK